MTDLKGTMPRTPTPLRLTSFVAVAWAFVAALWTIFTVLTDLLASSIPAPLDVAPFWFKVNPTQKLDGISGLVTGGGYDHATFMISGLGMDARLWYAGANFVIGFSSCVLGITLALLCNRVGRGVPFDRIVPRAFNVSGVTVLVGGFLWQIFNQIAGFRVIEETFHSNSWMVGNTGSSGIHQGTVGWPSGSTSFDINFWPLAAGLALFAIAVVFRYGAQLARDRATLAKEVDGLV